MFSVFALFANLLRFTSLTSLPNCALCTLLTFFFLSTCRTVLKSLAPIPECEEESLCREEEEEELPPRVQKTDTSSIAKPEQPATKLVLENKPSAGPILHRKPATEPLKAVVPSTSPSKPQGWEAIPKPKSHSGLDYSKWDKIEEDSSEDEDDEEDELPQYKFKVRSVGVRSVK